MEYCFLKGFLVVLLTQHCTSKGLSGVYSIYKTPKVFDTISLDLSTSIQSSTVISLQDDQSLPQEPELPPAEVVPVVAPPSLKEVQQAVQEASEQVEGRGAEEVLKELLERVVEAALGQVEGGGETKVDEAAVQEEDKEDALVAEKGETENDTEAEVLEQAVEEEVGNENVGAKEGDTDVGGEHEVADVDTFEDVAKEGKGDVEGEVETAAGSLEETTAVVQTGGIEEEGVEAIDESLDTEVSQVVEEETVAALEETGGYLAVGEDNEEQVVLSEEKGAAETVTQEAEETPPAVVELAAGGEPEQETVVESDRSLAVAPVVEQIGDVLQKEESLGEETQVDEMEGEVIVLPSNNYEMETTQTVVGEPVEEEEEVNIVKEAEGAEVEDEQGHLVVEGGAAEGVEAERTAEEGERLGESVIKEESVALVNEGLGDQQAGEEERIALETSHGSEKEDQEVLVISAPEPEDGAEASIEKSSGNQVPTPSPSLGVVETGEYTLGDEKSNHGNKIIAPTDVILDNFVKDVLAEHPQAESEEPGEANELVEDTAGTTETSELGLEAWKIGAISAAVFLVLETIVIIIYMIKSRNKNSTLALQRTCEEGCVEPEATTGGDCSDDTLPAGNGDTQQIAALDPSDVASTLAQNKEQNGEEHATAMSDLPPSSAEESAKTGPGSSQDLRTSIL